MARVNTKAAPREVQALRNEVVTLNEEGEIAFQLPAINRLIEKTVGAFWNEETFYKKGSSLASELVETAKEVASVEPKFVLQLAAYARTFLNLRTTPQVLLVEAANIEGCKPFVREYTPKIVRRADELADVIAYQLSSHGKPIPNSLKKGLAAAFVRFDEYQLNKYDSSSRVVKLGDVLQLIERRENYPVSKAMRAYLINDEVDEVALPKIAALKRLLAKESIDEEVLRLAKESSVTWETFISKFGASKETWTIVQPNMGYMALLRNLRNFIDNGVDLEPIIETLTDPEAVKKSKQLPFRFYSAYKQIVDGPKRSATDVQRVKRALANAFEASITNVEFSGSTAVFVDLSGSMSSLLSDKSSVRMWEVGAVLGAIAVKKAQNSIFIGFGTIAADIFANPDDRMMTNVEKVATVQARDGVGSATNAWRAFEQLGVRKVDRIVLISDMQCYTTQKSYWAAGSSAVDAQWNEYKKNVNPKARLYSIDVHSYGTAQLPINDSSVTTLYGWSDKIVDYIKLLEKGGSMADEIRKW